MRRSALLKLGVVLGTLLLVPLLAIAFFAIAALGAKYPNASRKAKAQDVVLGAYHVHSTASDGSGTEEEIAEAASASGLQFVILTDHNPPALAATHRAANGVLLIEAAELSTNWGHVVALAPDRLPAADELMGDPIAAISSLHGHAALAHPVQDHNGWTGDPTLAQRATFFELYSGDSMFRRALDEPLSVLLPAAGAYLTNARHALTALGGQDPEAVPRMFQVSRGAPKVALCAHDAHGFPSYAEMFDQLALYLPLGDAAALPADPREAARWIVTHLAQGEAYCTFRSLGDGSGFAIEPALPQRRAKVGQLIHVVLPQDTPPSEVQVRCYGECGVQQDGRSVLLKKKGPVHLEVWRRAPGRIFGAQWRPWLVPSPVAVDD